MCYTEFAFAFYSDTSIAGAEASGIACIAFIAGDTLNPVAFFAVTIYSCPRAS